MNYDNLFWNYKLKEQGEKDDKEIHGFMDSLGNSKDGYRKILILKKHFMTNGQYNSVLKTWQKELDAIFNLAERHVK